MPRDSGVVAAQKVRDALQKIYAEIRRLNQQVTVSPHDGLAIVTADTLHPEGPKFEIGPLVLTVPQRAKSRRVSRFYVVIKGTITFARHMTEGRLVTSSFATKIAYFRQSENRIEHVYGAHYDFDDNRISHPVFHSQVTTTATLVSAVRACHKHMEAPELCDLMARVPRNIRLPTAQMDFFAVLLQVCADHLMDDNSGSMEKLRYKNLVDWCAFFLGYGDHHGLHAGRTQNCARSHHWYRHTRQMLST